MNWFQDNSEREERGEEQDLEPILNNGIDNAPKTNDGTVRSIWPTLAPEVPVIQATTQAAQVPNFVPNIIYADHDDPRFNFGQRKGCVTVRPIYVKFEHSDKNWQ